MPLVGLASMGATGIPAPPATGREGKGGKQPCTHTFLWRMFQERDEAAEYVKAHHEGDTEADDWVDGLPLQSSSELATYH